MKKNQPKPSAPKPALRHAIVVTWQPSRVPCEYGFIMGFLAKSHTGGIDADVTELDHIGGRIAVVAADARVGQRVPLHDAAHKVAA